jgi:hypothetical protein
MQVRKRKRRSDPTKLIQKHKIKTWEHIGKGNAQILTPLKEIPNTRIKTSRDAQVRKRGRAQIPTPLMIPKHKIKNPREHAVRERGAQIRLT